MNDTAAIQAVYADYRRVKGRKVLQLICEVPLEQAPFVHKAFGEPTPDESTWVAIAKLDTSSFPERKTENVTGNKSRKWEELSPSQQAGIRCEEPGFGVFLREMYLAGFDTVGKGAADMVRELFDIATRSELNDPAHSGAWEKMDMEYQAWQRAPQHGAG